MISVSAGPNSYVMFGVRARVRLVSRSKRAERAVRAVVSRSSYWTSRSGMARRDLRVANVDNIMSGSWPPILLRQPPTPKALRWSGKHFGGQGVESILGGISESVSESMG